MEEKMKDMESDLRDDVNIIADGKRDPKKEGTHSKRSFLSKFLHFLKGVLFWCFLMIVISFVIFAGCLVFNPSICMKKSNRQLPPGFLESLDGTIFTVIWLGASCVVFLCHTLVMEVWGCVETCLGWNK